MSDVAVSRSGWFSIISTTATAVVVGFASTILLIMQAAQAVAPQGEGRGLGAEYQHLDIGRGEQLPRLLEDALGAEAVHEHIQAQFFAVGVAARNGSDRLG